MTLRQKRIIALLAIANVAVIVALVMLVARPYDTGPLPPTHTQALSPTQRACQWRATQLLSRAGLAGTVALTPDGSLHFEVTSPPAPGQTVDEAAQSVWTVFDVAQALQEQETDCATFTQVKVTIMVHNGQSDAQISASVSAADLAALGDGELSEEQFLERVTYATSAVRDE